MSNIKKAFENKKAFIGFLTAGDPNLNKTKDYILDMEKAGADLIEIGIPFSDPIAEGEVIQRANIRALNQLTNLEKIFSMVESVRKNTSIPLVFLSYANPIYNYGYKEFLAKCKEIGIDGIIIPDMPFEESGEIRNIAQIYNVDIITLIAPTSKERIKLICKEASGFIYLVSSMGVTGVRSNIETNISEMVETIRKYTSVPIAVGFGINTREQACEMRQKADGVIVGSGIVRIIEEYGENAQDYIMKYINELTR